MEQNSYSLSECCWGGLMGCVGVLGDKGSSCCGSGWGRGRADAQLTLHLAAPSSLGRSVGPMAPFPSASVEGNGFWSSPPPTRAFTSLPLQGGGEQGAGGRR